MVGRSDVVVIGGGVIGIACALELGRRGARVTVVDKGEIGHGCSYGNAGWLTPCLASPLPAPGILWTAMRFMLDAESPFYIRPVPSVALVRWLAGFALATGRARFERGVGILVEMSKYSLEAYHELARTSPEPLGFEQRGLLVVAESDRGLDAAVAGMDLVAVHGVSGQAMSAEAVRGLEPAIVRPVRGGVFFPGEAHVEPLAAVTAMAAGAARNGVRLLPETEVFELATASGRVDGVRTTRGWLRADRYVLATGSWSASLVRGLGLRLPILGGKGYAIVVPPLDPMPGIPIKLVERRIAITPRRDGVRLAGTLELVDGDDGISPRRVDAILRGSRAVLNVPEPPETVEVWRGLRPCTPDGLPVIGFPRAFGNLLIATGHQMLGLHCAPGTARLAADLLSGDRSVFDPEPFRADRF